MNDLQATADRVEIEALRGEFSDAAMMGDYDRFASLFTHDAVYRIPDAGIAQTGRDEIRAGTERLADAWEYFVQTTHPGAIKLDGDTASGRAYVSEIGPAPHNGTSIYNYALFHDQYRRTPDGWKFSERVFRTQVLRHHATARLTPGSLAATHGDPSVEATSKHELTGPGLVTGYTSQELDSIRTRSFSSLTSRQAWILVGVAQVEVVRERARVEAGLLGERVAFRIREIAGARVSVVAVMCTMSRV